MEIVENAAILPAPEDLGALEERKAEAAKTLAGASVESMLAGMEVSGQTSLQTFQIAVANVSSAFYENLNFIPSLPAYWSVEPPIISIIDD